MRYSRASTGHKYSAVGSTHSLESRITSGTSRRTFAGIQTCAGHCAHRARTVTPSFILMCRLMTHGRTCSRSAATCLLLASNPLKSATGVLQKTQTIRHICYPNTVRSGTMLIRSIPQEENAPPPPPPCLDLFLASHASRRAKMSLFRRGIDLGVKSALGKPYENVGLK